MRDMAEGNLGPAPEAGASGRVRAAVLGLVLLYGVMAVVALAVHLAVQGLTPTAFAPVFFAVYPAMGTLIVLRRGSHRIGWMLIAIGIVLLLQTTPDDYAIYAMALHPGSLPFGGAAVVLSQTIWIGGLFLFGVMLPLTFPTGHLMSKRWLIIVAFAVAYFILVTAGNAFIPNSIAGYPKITNPIGIKGQDELFNNLQTLSLIPAVVWILGAIASIVVRYRRSRAVEREQMKWFLFSFLLVPVALALNNVPVLDRLSFLIAVPGVAVGIAVAVLRYRLYDIDVVISRTLVYGALAAFITAVYVGIVVGVGSLVGSEGKPNLVLSIVATAIVAGALQPGRGAELHASATWPEPVSSNGSAPPTMQTIPIVSDELPKIEGADRAVAVQHQGELLGALSVAKRDGESLTPIEDKLVDDLAHQAGLVLKNVGLTAELLQRLEELRASRQRLFAAPGQERRPR